MRKREVKGHLGETFTLVIILRREMSLQSAVRLQLSQRVMRFKTVIINISEVIRQLEKSYISELLDVLEEVQNGGFTFEYSLSGLSHNMRARLKKMHFARKNIASNV